MENSVIRANENDCFRVRFCQYYLCSEQDFARRLFWQCLHRASLPLSALLYLIRPGYFHCDFILIHEVGASSTPRQFHGLLRSYQRQTSLASFRLKNQFRLRISGARLAKIRALLYNQDPLEALSASEDTAT